MQLVAVFAVLGLALWRRDTVLYLVACPVGIVYGLAYYDLYKTPSGFVTGLAIAFIGGYCLVLGIINLVKNIAGK